LFEVVPDTYGLILDTGSYDDTQVRLYDGNIGAIKFIIPDDGRDVLSDAWVYVGSGVPDITHVAGFSRTLTSDTSEWETFGTFVSVTGAWCKVIKDAKLQSTEGAVRCNPGETWYVMAKMLDSNSWFMAMDLWGATTISQDTQMYKCTSGSTFVNQNIDGSLRVYGYTDEVFYVNFDYSPNNPIINEQITFIDTSNQNLIETRQWLIENEVVGSGLTLTHTFTEEGTYGVTLVGVSYGGANLQMNKLIEVKDIWEPPEPKESDLLWVYIIGTGLAIVCITFGVLIWKRKKGKAVGK